VDLSGGWDMRLHGAIGRNVADGRQSYSSITTGAAAGTSNVRYINESKSAGLEAEGVLLRLPGGDARLSIGGGWRDNQYQQRNLISGAVLTGGAQRVFYGYGELGVPLVGDEMAVPYVHRLTLNLSGRYEAYDSFGDTATPKVGLLWSPVSGLDVRASWGRSFKAPTLSQQFQQQGIYLYPSTTLGGAAAGAPAGVPTLLLSGGNPDLSPERAETLALGFSVTPALIANTTFEFNWFHIDYRARIVSPISIFGQALSNPANSASVTSSPNVDEIRAAFARVGRAEGSFTGNFAGVPYNPANIFAIVDNLFTNTASDKLSGIDVAASHKVGLFDGDLVLRASGSWIINSKRRVTPLSPETLTAGQIYTPARFRGLAGLSWSSDGLILSSNVNHISGVLDTNQTPNVRTGAMTTADFVLDYSFEASGWGNLGFSISVMNLFNAKPPLIASGQPVYVNYDSTNYSALGRVINATIRARF
jgi:outer membrane receptor protein involved in Fe transport